jgi:hypothetical protein
MVFTSLSGNPLYSPYSSLPHFRRPGKNIYHSITREGRGDPALPHASSPRWPEPKGWPVEARPQTRCSPERHANSARVSPEEHSAER